MKIFFWICQAKHCSLIALENPLWKGTILVENLPYRMHLPTSTPKTHTSAHVSVCEYGPEKTKQKSRGQLLRALLL